MSSKRRLESLDPENQAYSESGEALKEPLSSEDSIAGALHGSSHVWIWRIVDGNIEVLLQLRAATKRTWPNHWDISAAGHLNFEETPLAAAVRETREEIGLNLTGDDLALLFVFRNNMTTDSGGIENEFQFVYGHHLATDLDFKLETIEVGEVAWVATAELEKIIAGESDKKIVPHPKEYFSLLLREIRRRET